MKACGLIVEYNPFHYGHEFHLTESRKKTQADVMVAVMSGSFLQRGEPAIVSKLERTKAALDAGVDLIVELPYIYSVQSAHYFAKGAMLTLDALHVDTVSFGSESGDIAAFYQANEAIESNQKAFDNYMKSYLDRGLAYPEAHAAAARELDLSHTIMTQPNNILGLSYVQIQTLYNLPIQMETIKRTGSGYHDQAISGKIASATSIRQALLDGQMTDIEGTMPNASYQALRQAQTEGALHKWEAYFPFLRYQILTMRPEELAQIQGVDEGIEYRVIEAAKQAANMTELIQGIQTKRYTTSRIMRMLTHLLTQTTKRELTPYLEADQVPYVRLLGFNAKGQAYLNTIKKSITPPLVSSYNRQHAALLEIEERASQVYNSVRPGQASAAALRAERRLPVRSEG